MSPAIERIATAVLSAAVGAALSAAGFSPAVKSGEASRAAQNECCPIARTCVERLGE